VKNKILLPFILSCCFSYADNQWLTLTKNQELTISGMATFKNGYIVVHDNKTPDQPYVSYIDDKYNFKKINWDRKSKNVFPFDLEGLTRIPLYLNQFILMESSGKCFRVKVDPENLKMSLVEAFRLPFVTKEHNLEGIELQLISGVYFIVYGDRGSDNRPSTLFTGKYNVETNKVSDVSSFIISFPKPKTNKRNIADLAIDKSNNLWAAATSDPGDIGPFQTFIYKVGSFSNSGDLIIKKPLFPKLFFKGQKVEALMVSDNLLYMMTDNESFGASFLRSSNSDIR